MDSSRWIILAVATSIIGTIISFVILLIRKMSKKQREGLERIAAAFGAQLDLGSWKKQPKIWGTMGSRQFEITFHVVSSGNSSTTYLDLKVNIAPKDYQLSVSKVGFGSKFFRKIGILKPIPTGDPYFDEQVLIHGKPEEAIYNLIYKPSFKDLVMKLTQRKYKVEIAAGATELVASKVYSMNKDLDEAVLRDNMDTLITLADTIEERW